MNCQDARSRLWEWLEGALGEGEAEKLRLHLEGCRACDAEASRRRAILEPDEVAPPDPDLPQRIRSAHAALRTRRRRRLAAFAAGYAAAFLLGVLVTLFAQGARAPRPHEPVSSPPSLSIEASAASADAPPRRIR